MAEIEDLHSNLLTDLSVFAMKIGLRNLSFSVDLIGLHHSSSLIGYFLEIQSILEILPEYTKEVANFYLVYDPLSMEIAMILMNLSALLTQYEIVDCNDWM